MTTDTTNPTITKPPKPDVGIKALKQFTRTLDALPCHEREALVAWLADRYLGIKLWGRLR